MIMGQAEIILPFYKDMHVTNILWLPSGRSNILVQCQWKNKESTRLCFGENFVQWYIQDCSVYADCNTETDHRLVLTSFSTRKQPYLPRLKTKPDIKSLRKSSVKAEYNIPITKFLQCECPTNTQEEISVRIIECLQIAFDKAVPKMKIAYMVRKVWK